MKKLLWILIVLVLVAIFGGRAWYLNKNKTDETNTVKIGAIIPMTGLVSGISDEIQNSLKMALEDLNKTNKKKISVIFEDGKYTEKDSINALHKIGTKGIDGLIVIGQLPAMGIGPFIKDYNIPVIVTIAAGDKIPTFNEYIFRFYIPSKQVGKEIANFTINDLKVKSVACLYIKNDMGKDAFKSFKDTIGQSDVALTIDEQYDLGTMDMRSQVAKVLNTNPEAIYVAGFGPGFTSTINAIKESGFKGYILSGGEILQPAYRMNIKNTDDIYFVDTIFDEYSTDEKVLNFTNRYKQKYNNTPGSFAAFTYEVLLILGKALQHQNNSEALNYLKHSVKNHLTVFGNISFDKNGEIDIPLVIKQMQPDGTAKIIKE